MYAALPRPDYYGGSAPPGEFGRRCTYPGRHAGFAPGREPPPGGSRVHWWPFVGV